MSRVHTRCGHPKGTEVKRLVILAAGLLAIGLVFAGCTKSDEPAKTTASPEKPASAIAISDAWARESTAMANAGAVYMNIKNEGSADDKLLSASVSPEVAMLAEVHETVGEHSKSEMSPSPGHQMGGDNSSSMMKMQKVESVAVPAGKTTKLEPGGYHVMLMKLAKPLKAGETVTVTLTFEKAGKKEVKATVKEA